VGRKKDNEHVGSGMEMRKVWEVLTECGICFALPRKVYSTLKICHPLYCDKRGTKQRKKQN